MTGTMDVLDEKTQPNGAPPMEIDEVVSVHDHEAFAAKHMPELGHDVKDFQVYTWRLNNWKKLDKKLTSDEFECGGHKWRILLFPFGNSNAPPNDTVSVYLDYAEPKKAPEGWHACAQFALVISNIHDPTVFTVSNAQHRFIAEESDWGFTRFSELRKLFHPQEGHSRPTIEEDSADITVYVRVLEDPTGVLWHNFVNYDSKKETGYVGLKNQGATCYMNSLLQSLYCTRYFRRAVYQIPTEDDIPTESVALALQRVFYHLQTSDQPVGTTELTKSFGWKSLDSFLQHDVQEFNRVLVDKLESKMKGTKAEGAIAKLLVGKMKSYIKCVNVDYESSRIEEFNDIQLNVKGMKNLYESFRDYVAVEMLDGENKYQAEGFGLQDAKKGIIFESFPPVLHLQLKRFEYDMQRDAMVKVNDRHEFPFELDLGEFLDSTADRSKPWVYKLHGVLVHSGDLHGGHYFALIKPDRETRWLKYDDDRVTPVTDKEVLEENYGGEAAFNGLPPTAQRNQVRAMKRFTNAYMLVYIRESAIDEVLAPFTDEDTPPHLKRRLDEERLQLEAKKREREEQHLFLTAKVITDETFSRHEGFDLATFDEKNWPPSDLPSFRVLKQETYSTFKSRVAQHFSYPENQIRLWVLVNRQNKTVRPDTPIPENEPTLTVEVIRNNMAARQNDLRLYLDIIPDPSKPDPPPQSIMIFLKHFDTSKQTLLGAGKVYMLRTSKEIKPGMIELMKPKLSFAQSEIQDGDVICFQVDLPEKEAHDIESQGLHSNPIHYYDFLQNRVMIVFRPKLEEVDNDHPEFSLVLSKKQNYDIMSHKAGEYLRHDPIKLRFTTTHATNGSPKSVLKRSLNQSIAEIMAPNYINPTTTIILYEKLDVSIVELETKRSLKVVWTGIHNKEEATHPFLLPKTSMVNDLADHISKLVTLTPTGSQKIRVFEISKGREDSEGVYWDRDDWEYSRTCRALRRGTRKPLFCGSYTHYPAHFQEIPMEELEADDLDKVIGVFHFTKELSRTHGVPFKFVVKRGEKFHDTKKRLQARIGASDKDLAKMRFAIIQSSTFKQPSYIEDDDTIYDHQFAPEDVLGLDHADKSGKTRIGAGGAGLTIRG
ncbi:Ubiquitin carboxyl-terminal hydrolase 21 [Mycena venus]|uniref:ubiquitinyl hydrolase 1 n=1 Tax=Mycena venus TaxID=2733690 RepID=A0A8H7CHY4_9AGAR|nr:Ubiquitin carboxyl-terminal hydrolase 21 [Mycena venus]